MHYDDSLSSTFKRLFNLAKSNEMKWKAAGLAVILLSVISLRAEISDLKFTTGYRQDRGHALLKIYNQKGKVIGKETIEVHNLAIYQVGGKASACVSSLAARAEIDYGWVNKGKMDATCMRQAQTPIYLEQSLKKNSTRDISLGCAYFLMNNAFCQLGPSVGYSKSQLSIATPKKELSKVNQDVDQMSIKYHHQWQGLFAGADAIIQLGDFILKGGYEYHWGRWRANSKLINAADTPPIMAKANSKQARGKVIYAEAAWNFCHCYTVGGTVKWQKWTAPQGHQSQVQKLASALWKGKKKGKAIKWDAMVATFDIGYCF